MEEGSSKTTKIPHNSSSKEVSGNNIKLFHADIGKFLDQQLFKYVQKFSDIDHNISKKEQQQIASSQRKFSTTNSFALLAANYDPTENSITPTQFVYSSPKLAPIEITTVPPISSSIANNSSSAGPTPSKEALLPLTHHVSGKQISKISPPTCKANDVDRSPSTSLINQNPPITAGGDTASLNNSISTTEPQPCLMDGDVLLGTFSSSACTNQPRGNDANHPEPGNTSCLSLRCNEEGNGDLQQSLIDGLNPPPTTNELSATNHSLLSYSNLGDANWTDPRNGSPSPANGDDEILGDHIRASPKQHTLLVSDSDPELTIAPPVDRPLINPPRLNRSMNIIIWNCRGGNNPEFKRNFRSLVDWHKPPLVALLETKKQNHQALLDKFPFTRMIEVPAAGNSGGLAILWNDALLELDQISTIDQEIHAMIKVNSKDYPWLLSCVYASTYRNKRRILWHNLKSIKDNYFGKWLIGGDFNEVLYSADKKGGNPVNGSRTNDFLDVVNCCEFIDMGFRGSKFTWLNKNFKNRGFPLFHKPPNKADFGYTIDNLKKRLSGWKIKFLNIDGRTTLVKSCLNNIPTHVMHYLKIPASVTKEIDRIQRNFVWGTTDTAKKIHLINWDILSLPKQKGGLAWTPPKKGLRLNIDGAFNHFSKSGGASGCLRHKMGCWVRDFSAKLNISSPFETELCSLFYGLLLVRSMALLHSLENPKMRHEQRQANGVADRMAKEGLKLPDDDQLFVIWIKPPLGVKKFPLGVKRFLEDTTITTSFEGPVVPQSNHNYDSTSFYFSSSCNAIVLDRLPSANSIIPYDVY
ncbi:hypothetical protein FXO37_30068 [Capsicum annuum]|nr:hypothetical protein FXO37_30068 [Capsicum annuum]